MERLRNYIKYLAGHRFSRDVITLQIGSFGGMMFQAVAGILLARILQPELFGIYALVFGMASLGGILLGAGNQEAVSTLLGSAYAQKDETEVRKVLAYLLKITIYAGLITALLMPFFPVLAGYFYGNSLIGWYACLVIVAVFLSSSFNAVVQLSLQVAGRIKALTLIVFGDQFFRSGLALLFVFMGFGMLGLVSGHIAGALIIFLTSVFMWGRIKEQSPLLPSLKNLFGDIGSVPVKKYFGFSFWVAVDRNISNLYMALPIVLAGVFVSTGEVSFFKLAFGYVNLALSLLGPISVLLNVEFSKMKIRDGSSLARNFIKVSLYGMGLSTVLTLAAIIVSSWAFSMFYGESFMPSVQYVSGLIVYGVLFGIGVGLGPMWRAINKVKVSILINLSVLGVGIPVGLLLIKNYGNWGAVVMVTLWFTVSQFASFIYLAKNIEKLSRS